MNIEIRELYLLRFIQYVSIILKNKFLAFNIDTEAATYIFIYTVIKKDLR